MDKMLNVLQKDMVVLTKTTAAKDRKLEVTILG